jgi:GNAT superfamily N-acetyltransferase
MDGMPEPIIRPAAEADEPFIRECAARLAAFDLPDWRTAEEIARADGAAMMTAIRGGSPDDEVFVAERDGVPVGCVHVFATTDFFGRRHAHLSVLATAAAAEGTGVARTLIAHAEAWTRARSLPFLTLNVFDRNTKARRLYDRTGLQLESLHYLKQV